MAILEELMKQFPLVAVTIIVSWYYMRILIKQQARELEAKNREIERLLFDKKNEIDRLLDERRKYFQLFLKELREGGDAGPAGENPSKKTKG